MICVVNINNTSQSVIPFLLQNQHMKQKVTIAKGDGIGPEIMEATLRILSAAGAQIETEEIEVG